jgi:hypothetical protein
MSPSERQSSIPEFARMLRDLKDLMGTSSQRIIEELVFQILMTRFPDLSSGNLSPAEETQLRREADELTDFLSEALDLSPSLEGSKDAEHQ